MAVRWYIGDCYCRSSGDTVQELYTPPKTAKERLQGSKVTLWRPAVLKHQVNQQHDVLQRGNEQLRHLLQQERQRAKESQERLQKELHKLRQTLVTYDKDMSEQYMKMQKQKDWLGEQLTDMKDKYSIRDDCKSSTSVTTARESHDARLRVKKEIKKRVALRVKLRHMMEKEERKADVTSAGQQSL